MRPHGLYSANGILNTREVMLTCDQMVGLPNKLLQTKKAPYSSKAPSLLMEGGLYHIVKLSRSR